MQNARLVAKSLLAWFRGHARDLPWRRTRDPYAIWISEVMLQQTTVKAVVPYWERWMQRLPSVRALARASEHCVLKLWEGLGYYSRARNLRRAAQLIMTNHHGRFPTEFEAVIELPGIGRYTAGAVCSIAFNQPHPVVDGNVIRVLTRLLGVRGNPKQRRVNNELWSLATRLVMAGQQVDREQGCSHLNQALMELGATICLPQSPRCPECSLRKFCIARSTGQPERFPQLPQRARAVDRHVAAFVVERGRRYLVRRRPTGGVNHGLWEFPNVEIGDGFDLSELARKHLGLDLGRAQPLSTIRHTITHYRITMDVFRCTAPRKHLRGEWLSLGDLNKLPFPSAHRKILTQIATGSLVA